MDLHKYFYPREGFAEPQGSFETNEGHSALRHPGKSLWQESIGSVEVDDAIPKCIPGCSVRAEVMICTKMPLFNAGPSGEVVRNVSERLVTRPPDRSVACESVIAGTIVNTVGCVLVGLTDLVEAIRLRVELGDLSCRAQLLCRGGRAYRCHRAASASAPWSLASQATT